MDNTNEKTPKKINEKDGLSIITYLKTHLSNSTSFVENYFSQHGNLFKLLGISIAIAGLFLNVKSEDAYIRRLTTFFLLITFFLLTWFILKSLYKLCRGKHSELYNAITLIPIYIGAVVIYNFWIFLIHNFSLELQYYFKVIGIPLIAICVNLFFLIFFKLILKFKKIKGKQLENFFLIVLNFNLVFAYTGSGFIFSKALQKILSLEFNNLYLALIFFTTLWSEIRSFDNQFRLSSLIETIILITIVILPVLAYYFLKFLIY